LVSELLPCAILVPSLNRPQRLRSLVNNIHWSTPEEHRLLFCVEDPESKHILFELGEWFLDDSGDSDHRYVTRMNKLIHHLKDANSIFFGSDDVLHHEGWLSSALSVMAAYDKSVIVVNDLHNPNGTQAVMRRSYLPKAVFDAPGDAFHSGYRHNFADTEQFFTAYMQDQYARAMESVVEHLHPVFGARNSLPWDDTYTDIVMNGPDWVEDKARFESRARRIEEVFRS